MGRRGNGGGGNKKKGNNSHHNFANGGGGSNQKKPHNDNKKGRNHKFKKRGGGGGGSDNPREMRIQLERIGLALKEINGDGNCLFRALADQLYGDSGDRYHMDLRSNTVEYMRRNREDFEPFFDPEYEGVTFDRHLDLLEEDGTFAGNDAIVAFARRYEAVVVIHQLNEPLWKVGEENGKEGRKRTKQLHISYHNGDHYNSVRMIGDLQSSGKAANVYIESAPQCDIPAGGGGASSDRDSYYGYSDEGEEEGDSNDEGDPGLQYHPRPDKATLRRLIEEVKDRTGSDNFSQIYESLKVNEFDVDAAVGEISLEAAKQTAAKARSTLGSSSPTPSKNGGKSGKKNRRRRGAIGEGDPQESGSVTQKLQTLTI